MSKKTINVPVELHLGKDEVHPANTDIELDAETADHLVKRHGGFVVTAGHREGAPTKPASEGEPDGKNKGGKNKGGKKDGDADKTGE